MPGVPRNAIDSTVRFEHRQAIPTKKRVFYNNMTWELQRFAAGRLTGVINLAYGCREPKGWEAREMKEDCKPFNRRDFLKLGAVSAGAAIGGQTAMQAADEEKAAPGMKYRDLGDTGLKVSEISMGTYGLDNPELQVTLVADDGTEYRSGKPDAVVLAGGSEHMAGRTRC